MMTGLIHEGTRRLAAAGLPSAQHEVEWLLGHLLDCSRPELRLQERDVPPQVAQRFWSALEARTTGTPLQYLIGSADFYGQRLAVAPGVFIPRPETEAIAEAALAALRERAAAVQRPLRLLDAGTGSGCLAITLARHLPACLVVAVELSWDALTAALANCRACGLSAQVQLVQGRWLEAIRGGFDGLVSNPPYIPSDDVRRLPLDVRQEPHVSLDGGADGFDALRILLADASRLLLPGGVMVLECGETQVETLLAMAAAQSWVEQGHPLRDLADRPRGVLITAK